MRLAPVKFLRSQLLCSVFLLTSTACSRKHEGPEVGDSVTNWLHRCSTDGECHGTAVCIDQLCSIPCSDTGIESCASLSLDAVCDPSNRLCDLPCESAAACSALGADFTCSAGHCRQQQSEATRTPAGTAVEDSRWPAPVSAALLDEDLQLTQGEPAVRSIVAKKTTQRSFDPQATFVLDQVSLRSGAQFASWQKDHWLVLWEILPTPADSRWQFDQVHIYPEGRYELERITLPYDDVQSSARFYSEDGRLALVSSNFGDKTPCSIAVSDIPKGISYAPSQFQCTGEGLIALTAAAVPGSDDWMLSWRVGVLIEDPEHPFRVARYNPLLPSWSAGPWEMHAPYLSLTGISAGSASNYVWSGLANDGFLYRFGRESPATVPVVSALPPADAEIRNTVVLPNGIMLLTWNAGNQSSATVVNDDGTRFGPVPLDPPPNSDFEALYIPEHNRVALCLTDPDLAVVMLDERARRVGSPTVVATGLERTRCNLAWSGRELLVTWIVGESDPVSARVIPGEALAP